MKRVQNLFYSLLWVIAFVVTAHLQSSAAEETYDFSYSYTDPSSAIADDYIVSKTNAVTKQEGSVIYRKPGIGAASDGSSPGILIFHFHFPKKVETAHLYAPLHTFHWDYSKGHGYLYGSTDGKNWQKLSEVVPPEFSKANGDSYNKLLPQSLTGTQDLWFKVELFSFGTSAPSGGVWTNTAQFSRYTDGSNTTTFKLGVNYEESSSVVEDNTVDSIKGSTQEVNGHFMHYGKGPYDWAYITVDGSLLAKLTGLDSNTGYLTWETLDIKSFSSVRIALTGKFVVFGKTTSNSAAAKVLAESVQKVDGHFMHYSSGAYDWIYVTTDSSLAAKLTGLDPKTDYLTWDILEKTSLGNININASADMIEFDASSSTDNDIEVTYTEGDMPHAAAYFNSLNASMAKSTSALVQTIYSINSFLYTDPSVTDLETFKGRKAQVDKALEVLQKYAQETTGFAEQINMKKMRYLFRADLSAEEIDAIVNSGDAKTPIATLMQDLKIDAQEAKKTLDDAMSELSSKYQAEASWWNIAARTADLVKNASALALTIGGAIVSGGATAVAEGALTLTYVEAAVLAVTATDAVLKTSKSGVELIVGEDVKLDGSVIGAVMTVTSDVSDIVAIKNLFTDPGTVVDTAGNIVFVTGKHIDLLFDKKVQFGDHSMQVSDEAYEVYIEALENGINNTLLPGTYHLPDGSTVTVTELPDKIIEILEVLPEDDKVDDVKDITLGCPFHQKVLGDVCVNKTCYMDAYNCPDCAEGEELKFKEDRSGYCEKIPLPSCIAPECCSEKPQACGSMCLLSSAVCCDNGAGYCLAGAVCVAGGKCCPAETPQACGSKCILANSVCCGDYACLFGSVCMNGGCCPESQVCGDKCLSAGSVCCGGSNSCGAGFLCCGSGCMPADYICYGDTSCKVGYVPCYGGCIPDGAVCCSDHYCDAGDVCCGAGCMPSGAMCCDGAGHYCPNGGVCTSTGCSY